MSEIVIHPRRHRRRDLLSIAGAAVAGVAGMKATPAGVATADPIIGLMRQAHKLELGAIRLENQASTMQGRGGQATE